MPQALPSADRLTLAEAVGQLICPTLYHGLARGKPYDASRAAEGLSRYGWGGMIVFHDGAEALRERLSALVPHARLPLLVAADLEQGAGQQIAGLGAFPPAMAFGATDQPAYAYELGAITAGEALSVGINWILAPVADVTNNPQNPIINIRSFGGDPTRVAAMVEAFVSGCQDHGALACAKHFPGHGDTAVDSHTHLARVEAGRERLETVEFPPFRAAIAAGVGAIMTAHVAVPALDGPDVPATLSRPMLSGLLRQAWGFNGLIVTDAMIMGGIGESLDADQAAVQAIAAGCDMLLMPADPVASFEALVRAVETGQLPEARIREAASRVLAAKSRIASPGRARPIGPPDALARRVAGEALTLAKGEVPRWGPKTLVIAVDDGVELDRLATWDAATAARGFSARRCVSIETPDGDWRSLLAEAEGAEHVLMGVFSPIRFNKERSLLGEKLLAPLQAIARRCPTVVVSFSSPFLVAQFPEATSWVLAYGSRPVQIEAAIASLCEGKGFPGRLPVELPAHLAAALGGRQAPDDKAPPFA